MAPLPEALIVIQWSWAAHEPVTPANEPDEGAGVGVGVNVVVVTAACDVVVVGELVVVGVNGFEQVPPGDCPAGSWLQISFQPASTAASQGRLRTGLTVPL